MERLVKYFIKNFHITYRKILQSNTLEIKNFDLYEKHSSIRIFVKAKTQIEQNNYTKLRKLQFLVSFRFLCMDIIE